VPLTPTPQPTGAVIAAKPTDSAEPSEVTKPGDPAKPSAAVRFSGAFEPAALRVGGRLDIRLEVANRGGQPINGLRIFSNGPWDAFTVLSVLPSGSLQRGLLGWNIESSIVIAPGDTGMIRITASPNEPGNHRFTFLPYSGTTRLLEEGGEHSVIAGNVNVTR
jgi:hypothetical protein